MNVVEVSAIALLVSVLVAGVGFRLAVVAARKPVSAAIADGIEWETGGELDILVRKMARELAEANEKIRKIEETNRQLIDDNRKLEEANRRLDTRIAELEAELAALMRKPVAQYGLPPAKPLLLVAGPDAWAEEGVVALRRTRIPFQRLSDASKTALDNELRRRRTDGSMYWYMVIWAHMQGTKFRLQDGVVDAAWLNANLRDIKILFLAGCENAEIGDQVAGLCDYVVTVNDPIEGRDAAAFSYAFWSEIVAGKNAADSYRQALKECPQVAEFVDLRTG